jgi:hypothetical protein
MLKSRVADHFRVNHSIIVRLMQRFRQTGNVTDRPRVGRPRKATPREDRLISRRARQRPLSTAGALRGNLAFGGHISTRTVIRRLHLRVERAHCHGIFGQSDYHQERTSPTYSQRKNNPRQLHPTPKSSCAQNMVVLK